MLQPKKTKFRRVQKGRAKGNAQRGNQLAFGSFGWGVGGPEMIQKKLEEIKYPTITPAPLKAKQRPNAETLQACREAGAALAQAAWDRYLKTKTL